MPFADQARRLIEDEQIREASTNLLFDVSEAVLGNHVSYAKILLSLIRYPFLLRESLFCSKLELYLNGVFVSDEDRATFRAKLIEDGARPENAKRLIECIDRAETNRKIAYLINATRCFMTDFIDRTKFFRICHAITGTIEEDLIYLRDHIIEQRLNYCEEVQGLLNSGLMYINSVGDPTTYSFTSLARYVDRYAISYDDVVRYPDPNAPFPDEAHMTETPPAVFG